MSKYHIMYFLDYAKSFGGAANTLLQQAVLMKEAGQNVTVVASDYWNTSLGQRFYYICSIYKIDIMRLTYPIASQPEDIDIVSVLQNYEAIKTAISKVMPNILHSVQLNPIVELVSRELHIPHVMDIYQLNCDFFKINYINIFPHYHICDSEFFARKWNYYLNTESVCIRTVVNCPEEVANRDFSKHDVLNYLCVGAVCPRKNQLEVIKAFHCALQQSVKGRLLIYGQDENDYAEKCKEYVRKNKLENSILFKGFCENMSKAYQEADVLICGSTVESYPNVVSEALCYGLIVISTPVAGVPEVIQDQENGYLCSGYQEEDILKKILELELEREKGDIDTILEKAYNTFETHHSPACVSAKLFDYYEDLIKKYKPYSGILIEDVKREFSALISQYRSKVRPTLNNRSIERKIWYIYHVKEIISNKALAEKRYIYIWGTGKYGNIVKEIWDIFFEELQVQGFIDTYKTGTFLGYKIYSPQQLLDDENCFFLIATIKGQKEIIPLLEKNRKRYCEDYLILSPRSW